MKKIGIIMNGVTGRMGTNQHLLRSLAPFGTKAASWGREMRS